VLPCTRLPTPSLDNLRCFIAAARLLRFSRAAKSVALTPTAFGQRIKQLEEQVGKSLFARTTRSVTLTEAGLALLPHAERCLAVAEEGVRAARGEIGPPPTDLVLGTRHELGLSWILPQLDALTAERPWLNLHLAFGSAPDLHRHVRTLEIDCAVTSARITDPKLDAIRLHREDDVLVGAATRLARVPLVRPDDAANHVLLDISADLPLFRYWRDAPGAATSVRFAKHTYLGTIAAIRSRVVSGAGVAVLPEYLVRGDLEAGRVKRLLPKVKPLHDHFRLVFRADDPRRVLFESLAASLAKTPLA
jgi:LysR family transcriptional regulator, glycine cleavage system transcriptional activator